MDKDLPTPEGGREPNLEISQGLNRCILEALHRKVPEADLGSGSGMSTAELGVEGEYDRLFIIIPPPLPGLVTHAIFYSSEGGGWRTDGGVFYEILEKEKGIEIERIVNGPTLELELPQKHAEMTQTELDEAVKESEIERQRTLFNADQVARELGLTKMNRAEAEELLRLIEAAEPL